MVTGLCTRPATRFHRRRPLVQNVTSLVSLHYRPSLELVLANFLRMILISVRSSFACRGGRRRKVSGATLQRACRVPNVWNGRGVALNSVRYLADLMVAACDLVKIQETVDILRTTRSNAPARPRIRLLIMLDARYDMASAFQRTHHHFSPSSNGEANGDKGRLKTRHRYRTSMKVYACACDS